MPALVIADVEITDPTGFEEYRARVPATIAAYGGRYLVRGGATEVKEGDWSPRRLIVLEFPSLARARAWYASPEYTPLIALRERTARTRLVFAEGYAG
ncbi:MAG: DUF1330 domain-containing protein [Deltaproteobacteria bacterium]|nr:DUF1330 domain-containing protein [Deltaproteobacteria bacterium]